MFPSKLDDLEPAFFVIDATVWTLVITGKDIGGFMALGPSYSDLYRRAALVVDKILKGAKPADLPVEQANKFEMIVNLKTAKALGLTISPIFLARVDEVIE